MRLRLFPDAMRRAAARVFGRRPRPGDGTAPEVSPSASPDPALRSRAAGAIEEYAGAHAALFERAERLGEKADRLEEDGTPSESARNRAERARREVAAGLAALRVSFAAPDAGDAPGGEAPEDERRRAFDREWERLYPAFKVSGGFA